MSYDSWTTKEEYMKFINEIVDKQYNLIEEDIPEEAWIPGEPEKIIPLYNNNGIIDITGAKKDKILEAYKKCNNLRIGNFILKLYRSGYEETNEISLSIYEESQCIYLNRPSKRTTRINPISDFRFENRSWLSHFNKSATGTYIPENTIFDIIRWLDAINKLGAFI